MKYYCEVAFCVSLALSAGWVVALIIAEVWKDVWNWIDDNENPITRNPLIRMVMRWRGYKPSREQDIWGYKKDGELGGADGDFAIFIPILLLFSAPFLVLFAVWVYQATLIVAVLFLVAHVTRFVRRHRKLFDRHVKDPKAHSQTES